MAGTGGTFRVAVLTRSEVDMIKTVLGSDFMDCLVDYYPVNSLMDIREMFLQVRDSYDGILTTGLFSDRMIACNNDTGIPHRYFSASVENYYRQILLQVVHNPCLELSQIRLDLMEREHNLQSIIESNTLGTLMNEEHSRVYKMTPAEVLAFEQEMVARHEWAILSGGYRLYMTRSPIAGEIFKKHNVEFLHVQLTPGEITDIFKSLRRDMRMKQLQGGQAACVRLELIKEAGEDALSKLKRGLEEYQQTQSTYRFEWLEESGGFRTLTDARTIDEITHGRKYSSLSGFFRKRDLHLMVGYGIGNTAQEADENAAAAIGYRRSAPANADWVYLVDENGQVNSLDTDFSKEASQEEKSRSGRPAGVMESMVNRIAQTSHLSSRTVLNLLTALQRDNRREAGSEWLIREMGISPRTANKILSNLEKAGYAEISGRTMQVSKGRPTNIYRFRFE